MVLSTLSPSKRKHKVALQNPGAPVPDGEGGYTEGWTDLNPATTWVSIDTATPQNMERFGPAGIAQTKASSVINMPYHPGITTETRILFNGRTFFVIGMQNPHEENVELWLAVEERVSTSGPATVHASAPTAVSREERNA